MFFFLFFFLHKSSFRFLFTQQRDKIHGRTWVIKTWSQMIQNSLDSSGKREKSNTNIIHKALVQHHTVWVNCSQKVKWSLMPMQWQKSKQTNKKKIKKKKTSCYHFKTNKTKTGFCLEIFTYGHCSVHHKEHYGGKMCQKKKIE